MSRAIRACTWNMPLTASSTESAMSAFRCSVLEGRSLTQERRPLGCRMADITSAQRATSARLAPCGDASPPDLPPRPHATHLASADVVSGETS